MSTDPENSTLFTTSPERKTTGAEECKRDNVGKLIYRDAHIKFVLGLDKKKDTFEYYATEHLRMSGIYWALMAMDLMKAMDQMDRDGIIEFVASCYDSKSGGYGGNKGHDPHMLYTLSAIQILVMLDALDELDTKAVAAYIVSLQQSDGSFLGDKWGEVDTRFSYCAFNGLALLGALDECDVERGVEFVVSCKNFDGGFGAVPGGESHAGQIFCCVGALVIAHHQSKVDALRHLEPEVLGWWLAERQLPTGGLNGRPEKKQDVCYSWWVLSSLSMLDKISWIDTPRLVRYIQDCQDPKGGGISDRPGNMADVFHTYFGLAGLSLLGCKGLNAVDPVYALPVRIVKKLGLKVAYAVPKN